MSTTFWFGSLNYGRLAAQSRRSSRKRLPSAATIAEILEDRCLLAVISVAPPHPDHIPDATGSIERTGGGQPQPDPFPISPNGRFVAFVSTSKLLAENDRDARPDIFVRDLTLGTTELISVNPQGTESGNFSSRFPAMSANGRFVAFMSYADNLVPDRPASDARPGADVYLRDRSTGQTVLISADGINEQGNWVHRHSERPSISPDGRFVAFVNESYRRGQDPVGSASRDLFIYDRTTGDVRLLTPDRLSGRREAVWKIGAVQFSADGRYLAFDAFGANLVPGDSSRDNQFHVYLLELATGDLRRVTTRQDGTAAPGALSAISADGRTVLFHSRAAGLTDHPGDTAILGSHGKLYAYDRLNGEVTLISMKYDNSGPVAVAGSSLSPDGRYIAFETGSQEIVEDDNAFGIKIFLHDRATGEMRLVTGVRAPGTSWGESGKVSFSQDGSRFSFVSTSRMLTSIVSNASLYLYDIEDDEVTALAATGENTGDLSHGAVMSGDGNRIAFISALDGLVPRDGNFQDDLFAWDIRSGSALLVSARNPAIPVETGNLGTGPQSPRHENTYSSTQSIISADGRYVVFASSATNLASVPTHWSQAQNVYLRDLQSGTTTMVSVNASGTTAANAGGRSGSNAPIISADGRFIVYGSNAFDLTPDSTTTPGEYLYDVRAGTNHRLWDGVGQTSISDDGGVVVSGSRVYLRGVGEEHTFHPNASGVISGEGRWIVFTSTSNDIVAGDRNNSVDVFLTTTSGGPPLLVSHAPDGSGAAGGSRNPVISADGRFVAYLRGTQVCLFDRETGATTVPTADLHPETIANAPRISADGRFVAFTTHLPSIYGPGSQVYLFDRLVGTTREVSADVPGTQANSSSGNPWLSSDGRFLTFSSRQAFGATEHVYVFDRLRDTMRLLSGSEVGRGGGSFPRVSAGGDVVVFASGSPDLVRGDAGPHADLFVAPTSAQNDIIVRGLTAEVYGTLADDDLVVNVDQTIRIVVNGQSWSLDANEVSTIRLNGLSGSDSLILRGSAADETVRLGGGTIAFDGPGLRIRGEGIQTVRVTGGGGHDTASLFDSAGNDRLAARPESVLLSGDGYLYRVTGFAEVVARGTAGGDDRADFYDSPGDDRMTLKSTYSEMTGAGFSNRAIGFGTVVVRADAGGTDDRAWFHDSPGDDSLRAESNRVIFSGDGFRNLARGFDRTFAYSINGGADEATYVDSPGDDRLLMKSGYARMSGNGFYNYVRGFARVLAYATAGGEDRADFYDSAGDDRFIGRPTFARMTGDGFFNYAKGFGRVFAYATEGGQDVAELYDSAGDDLYRSRPAYARMEGAGFYLDTRVFETVIARSTGGNDLALLEDFQTGERISGSGSQFRGIRSNRDERLSGFSRIRAAAKTGETPTSSINPAEIDFAFEQIGDWAS